MIHLILLLTTGLTTAAVHVTTTDFMAELARLSKEEREGSSRGAKRDRVIEETPFEAALRFAQKADYVNAVARFKKLSDKGDHNATFALAMLHQLGLGVDQSNEAARVLFEKAAASNHLSSQIELAKLIEKKEPQRALALFRKAGEAGQPVANLKLGYCYENGTLGVPKNPKLALSYYEKSAEAGMWFAKGELARCYDLGIGISPDASKATSLYREAASNGVAGAQLAMAKRSFEGKGMVVDRAGAVAWLKISSQSGLDEAQVLLGDCFEQGNGVTQDYGQAGHYYSAAAKQGNPLGRQRLAGLYREGKGTTKDPIRAYVLLEPAKGHPLADKDLKELVDSLSPEQLKNAQAKLAQLEAAEKTEEQ